ncbi:hypothetical protein AAVH_18674 [Aphelenchoides avenae]|nr:hypothetical protein AAVH_18674 [Aphelenchus avenae]
MLKMRVAAVGIFLYAFYFCPTHSVTAKEVCVSKFRNLLSSFSTADQYGKILDAVGTDVYNMKTMAEISTTIRNTVMKSLTGSQMTKAMTMYNAMAQDLGGTDKAMEVINIFFNVLTNNVSAFIMQMQDVMRNMKANGKTQAACINRGYVMTSQYLTQDRVKLVLQRFKGRLTAKQWATAYKNLSQVVLLKKYFSS